MHAPSLVVGPTNDPIPNPPSIRQLRVGRQGINTLFSDITIRSRLAVLPDRLVRVRIPEADRYILSAEDRPTVPRMQGINPVGDEIHDRLEFADPNTREGFAQALVCNEEAWVGTFAVRHLTDLTQFDEAEANIDGVFEGEDITQITETVERFTLLIDDDDRRFVHLLLSFMYLRARPLHSVLLSMWVVFRCAWSGGYQGQGVGPFCRGSGSSRCEAANAQVFGGPWCCSFPWCRADTTKYSTGPQWGGDPQNIQVIPPSKKLPPTHQELKN